MHIPWWAFAVLMLAVNAMGTWFGVSVAEKLLVVLLATEVPILAAMAISVALHGGGPDGFGLDPVNPVNAFKGTAPASASSSPSGPGSASSRRRCTARSPATRRRSSPRRR